MAGLTPLVKLEDDVLRKYYRSFHKHGAPNWAKVSKDTKLSAEQCEMLHKQHMSFLSLPPSPALETAFLAMVDDHYNATQAKLLKDELKEEDLAYGGRARRGEPEDEAQVATSSSQKPRRTPKPTPQRLAAEEEQAARRLAKANQATPKSAKAKIPAKAPPSPPTGEWTSSQRKRSRRLFEDGGEPDGSRYRSPVIDRWRGRHNTDVDEGVDALLSLASGAHASGALDEQPAGTDIASNTADHDFELAEPEALEETPKRSRGVRGARTTPTPSGTPVKASGRSSAAAAAASAGAADTVPVPNATGLRSPRTRGGASSSAAAAAGAPVAAATNSGRGGAASGVRPKKETLASPTDSQQRAGAAAGAGSTAAATATTAEGGSDGGAAAPQGTEGTVAAGDGSTPDAAAAATAAAAAASPGPSGRPVRKRKPTKLAIAAAAAAEEEEGANARGVRSVVAAVAAAVAAAEASQAAAVAAAPAAAQPETSAASPDTESTQAGDLATNTAALLASVPPVRTRASARIANGGPGSRRAGERPSPQIGGADSGGKEARASSDTEPAAEAGPSTEAPAAAPGRGKGAASTGHGPTPAQPSVPPPVRFGPVPVAVHPPPGRTRRRKSLPERLPPFWQPVKIVTPRAGARGGSKAQAAGAEAALGSGETAAAMPDAEKALRRCLTGPRLRRWCMYEFHYSALDRPWFMRNELLEFCALHMQLPTTKLTRLEWSVLRAALGRPRRLSLAFLREERLRLEGYREHARLKYEEVNLGLEVPPELPRQLRVGQEVVAPHPYSRQLYDGVILTVKGSNYRVQFHRSELMTELIRDTDVMPVDPHECMPLSMAVLPVMLNGRVYDPVRLANARGLLPPAGVGLRPPVLPPRPLGSYTTGLDTQMMREQEAAMVAEVQRALEVKEELVAQLTQLNNEAASGLHTDENGGRTDNFQLKYTNVVLKLRDTNAVLEAALSRLQARQQQILAAPAAALGPVLALQQQQQLAAAAAASAGGTAAAVPALGGSVARPAPPAPVTVAAGAPILPQPAVGAPGLQQQPQRQALTQAPVLPQAQTLSQATPQTPPSQQAQPQPLPSPTSSASALPLAPPAAPAAAAAPVPSAQPAGTAPPAGQQGRAAAAKPPVPPPSPTAPLVVPQARPSSAPGSAAGPLATNVAPTLSGLTQAASMPAQLVELALVEARTVVDGCRGKGSDGQPLLLPAPPQPVPVVAPIILQSHGGTSLPLVLPPGAVLPQQLVAQQHPAAAADGQPPEHAAAMPGASVPAPAQVPPMDGEGSSEDRTTAGGLAECSGGGTDRGVSVDGADACVSRSVHLKTEDEGATVRGCLEVTVSADRAADRGEPSGRQRAEPQCMTEEELAESWLRDVIVGCVGVLFTIQKCTAGNVPATTVAEALDLAVQQLRIRTEGENDALYGDIVQSVQGLKGHLTRAFA